MVEVCFGHVDFSVPKELMGNEIAEEAIIYGDIASILIAIPEVLKEHPRLKESIKSDTELLQTLLELGHIVAG